MTITLSDLASVTETYIENEVDVGIARVTRNLEPGELGSFTIRVTNASAPTGVRLRNVFLHLTVEPSGVVSLIPPSGALVIPRSEPDFNAPELSTNERVDVMYVFYAGDASDLVPSSTLDPGDVLEQEIQFEAEAAGDATFQAHIHATVDVDELFPPNEPGTSARRAVTILP